MESNTLPLCQLLIGLNKKKKRIAVLTTIHSLHLQILQHCQLIVNNGFGYIFEIRVEGLVIRSKYLPNMQKRSKRHKFAIIITSIALC